MSINAQESETSLDNARQYFSAYVGGGIHSLLFSPKDGASQLGGGGMFGLQYQKYVSSQWGLSAGVQFSWLNSGAKYGFTEVVRDVIHPDNNWYYDSYVTFSDWSEKQHVFAIGIPIEALYRMPFRPKSNFVFGAGVLVDFIVSSSFKTVDGSYLAEGYFYNTNTMYSDMSKHGFTSFQNGAKGDISTSAVSLSFIADAGVNFVLNERWRMYVGLYGGYGLVNIAKTDGLALLTPYSCNANEVVQTTYNGTFASNQVSSIHPFVVGVKVGVSMSHSGKLLNLDFLKKSETNDDDESLDSQNDGKVSKDSSKDKASKDSSKDKASKDSSKDKASKDSSKDKASKDVSKESDKKEQDAAKTEGTKKVETSTPQKQSSDKTKSATSDTQKSSSVGNVSQSAVPDPMFDYTESAGNGPTEAQTSMLMYIDMVKDYADGARFYADDKNNPDAYIAAAEAEAASREAVEAALLGDFDKVVASIERSQKAFEKARSAKRIEKPKDTVVVQEKKKEYLSELENPNIVLTVHFQVNGKDLSIDAESRTMLERLADTLFENPALKIRITGHTDNTGGASVNLRMGMHRAQNLAEYLEEMGVSPEQIEVLSKGQTEPIADNRTAQGRATNRRATIEILQ